MSTPPAVNVGVQTDVGDVAMAAAYFFKFLDGMNAVANSPQMLALRQSADIQAILNQDDADLATAKKTGDLTQINKEASG